MHFIKSIKFSDLCQKHKKLDRPFWGSCPLSELQLGRREAPCLGKCYKAFFFGHYINFIPWHKSHFNVTDVLVLSVTYVFVSYRQTLFGPLSLELLVA